MTGWLASLNWETNLATRSLWRSEWLSSWACRNEWRIDASLFRLGSVLRVSCLQSSSPVRLETGIPNSERLFLNNIRFVIYKYSDSPFKGTVNEILRSGELDSQCHFLIKPSSEQKWLRYHCSSSKTIDYFHCRLKDAVETMREFNRICHLKKSFLIFTQKKV